MKKLLLSTLMVLGMNAYAQNLWQNNGPIGIGTTTPATALEIKDGTLKISRPTGLGVMMDINSNVSWAREYGITSRSKGKMAAFGAYGYADTLRYAYIGGGSPTDSNVYNTPWMVFKPNGSIGIGPGNINPVAILSVNGPVTVWSGVRSGDARPAIAAGSIKGEIRAIAPDWDAGDDGFLRLSAGGGTNPLTKCFIDISGYSVNGEMNQNIILGTNGTERMRVLSNGNVGIGMTAPDVKLAVNGDIRAKRIKVTATGWPDYVFGSNYQLMDIMQVAAFIEKNKHLPELPSAAQVEKDGDIELGDMNKVLLKKIEELTLYIIELKKENTAMKERLDRNGIE
ncbi:hypothetical protein [Chitinophaga terrae (ex Kim and Jung 2007)]|nr:hypothetical protein [Chitinophaga terrae (ex Kim and Jung 2007)]